MEFNKLYINGKYIDSSSGEFIDVENPSTREIIAKVPKANEEDVDKAVKAASEAFKTWKMSSVKSRIEIMENFLEYVEDNVDEIANIITEEQGSPTNFSKVSQVGNNINRIKAYIDIVNNFQFEVNMGRNIVRYEPVGVVACFTPWNFPMGQIIQKIIPAILSGSTVVLKPSQITPLTAYYIVEGFNNAGLPEGVLNLVTGKGSEIGHILSGHKLVDKVSFTGSTTGGKEVSKVAISSIKRVTLELGGKSPGIFLDSSNIDIGLNRIFGSLFGNCGQTCVAMSRAIVLEDIKDEFMKKLKEKYKTIIMGNPKDANVNLGPLSSEKQFNKVKKYIEIGVDEGADLILGKIPDKYDNGYFVEPVIFDNVKNNMVIAQEEIFGPVLSIITVKDEKEALKVANDTIYGLSAGVFGKRENAMKLAREIESGEVYVNSSFGDSYIPFGGFKQSGIGREGGILGFKEFLEIKSIIL